MFTKLTEKWLFSPRGATSRQGGHNSMIKNFIYDRAEERYHIVYCLCLHDSNHMWKKKKQLRNNYMAWWIRKVETEKTTSLPVYRYPCVSSTERKITLQGVFVIPVDYSITSLIIVLHHFLGHTFRKASGHLTDHCTDLILSMYRFGQDRISLNTAAQNSNYC